MGYMYVFVCVQTRTYACVRMGLYVRVGACMRDFMKPRLLYTLPGNTAS